MVLWKIVESLRGNTAGAFACPKEVRNAKETKTTMFFSWLSELTDGRFCPSMPKKEASRYEKYQRDPETRKRYGRAWKKEYVTVTLQSIHYVKIVKDKESWHQQLKCIISSPWHEVGHTMKAT